MFHCRLQLPCCHSKLCTVKLNKVVSHCAASQRQHTTNIDFIYRETPLVEKSADGLTLHQRASAASVFTGWHADMQPSSSSAVSERMRSKERLLSLAFFSGLVILWVISWLNTNRCSSTVHTFSCSRTGSGVGRCGNCSLSVAVFTEQWLLHEPLQETKKPQREKRKSLSPLPRYN